MPQPSTPTEPPSRILSSMLERIFASIVSGPALNCRPHASRQRIDFVTLARLGSLAPGQALATLLSEPAAVTVDAKVPAPPQRAPSTRSGPAPREIPLDDEPEELRAARRAYSDQQSLLTKLRILADDAKTYEQDTGVHALSVGYPLLSLPPGDATPAARFGSGTRRILAPLAFIPVDLTIRAGLAGGGVTIACRSDEIDRVMPNEGLLAWIERQTGRELKELFADEQGKDPWREIRGICEYVAAALSLPVPAFLSDPPGVAPTVEPSPKSDDATKATILPSAVLGLFPLSKQGLLRDTKAMIAGEKLSGPVDRFLRASPRDSAAATPTTPPPPEPEPLAPAQRRLVTNADPCQARAVALARQCEALVIHGPPGTGKSQTITNIIADHLARGQRVLFVCDKRTALDVVANRLDHLGLGALCALVHDPQRDQRDLYRHIREQIENLADTKPPPATERQLADADDELTRIHAELSQYHDALMHPPAPGEDPLHVLIGRWLGASLDCAQTQPAPRLLDPTALKGCTLRAFETRAIDLQVILRNAQSSSFHDNPWARAAGVSLASYLAIPMDTVRQRLAGALDAARNSDSLRHPSIPPFTAAHSLPDQATDRTRLADALRAARADAPPPLRELWLARDTETIGRSLRSLDNVQSHIDTIRQTPLDPELLLIIRAAPPNPADLAASISTLDTYLASADKWHAKLHLTGRAAAKRVLAPLGLSLTPEAARRARTFLGTVLSTLVVSSVIDQFRHTTSTGLPETSELAQGVAQHRSVLTVLNLVHQTPTLQPLLDPLRRALVADAATEPTLLEGLARSAPLAQALAALEQAVTNVALFDPRWLGTASTAWRALESAEKPLQLLTDRLPTLESVLRIREGLAALPGPLAAATRSLLSGAVNVDTAQLVLRQGILACEVAERIAATPLAGSLDPLRLDSLFDRWRQVEIRKHTLVRDAALTHWLTRQRSRLLASTGSRLNADGAELRRRVASRGTHALRLRQVLELGRNVPDGDPLLDLRPVWMASPETVAQIFPRQPIFDIIVFDEASQCRLEEALPTLTRAARVVIAGDPKQLPPTRFFEDTAHAATDAEDIQTDQDLFETQQSDVEDLLSAALNLDLHQSYLDVHYRSRNADLIAFSNEQFYSSRLQPIPGHPANRTRYAPLTLYHAHGVYDKRANPAEADLVVKIIRDLLRRAAPPSIGVGCFNVAQRDLIVERLDEAAAADPAFAAALGTARTRQGTGSFEGLFVKNLENVQGDERDHIIISTTYGPDPGGRFYRRFGPLAMPGGGRRLNVLVTRARAEVHLVTSIPPSVYRALPPVAPGQIAGGGWLLFAYLNYAERLAALYELAHAVQSPARVPATPPDDHADADAPEHAPQPAVAPPAPPPKPQVHVNDVRNPSALAATLAQSLVNRSHTGATVCWGNDGFCIDVALDHPTRPDDVTLGVLTDFARFDLSGDRLEWDAFRTTILQSQGWDLQRTWSPLLFRDLSGASEQILAKAAAIAQKPPRDFNGAA